MATRRTYPQHSAREHGTGVLFLAAILLAFAIVFASSIPQAFALQPAASDEAATEPTEAMVSEIVPIQAVPLFETLSGFLSEADAAWAHPQLESGAVTNQTVSLVLTQQADAIRVLGIASFVAIGLGGLAIAFVMRRANAPRAKVLQYN